ncbi:protein ANTI-SILENCING 1 [Forsythia ovata]|uniref:Protein ANTI-SILENCING 1 n=1 Tax=Forsythia ovata TaxID=205694 RepID=A0ABD1WFD3_9LAMI
MPLVFLVTVEFVFNRKESNNTLDIPKLGSKNKGDDRNAIACKEILKLADPNTPEVLKTRESDGNKLAGQNSAEELKTRESDGNYDLMDKEREKSARKSGDLDNSSLKSSKLDDSSKLSKDEDKSGIQILAFPGNGTKPVVTNIISSDAKPKPGREKNTVGPGEKAKLAESLSALDERPSKANLFSSKEKTKSGDHEHSVRTGKDSELIDNSSALRERPSNTNVVSPKLKPKSGHDKNSIGPGQAAKLAEDSSALERRPSKSSVFPLKERPSVHDIGHEKNSVGLRKDAKFAANPYALDERPSKKAKKIRIIQVPKLDKSVGSEAKKLLTAVTSNEDKTRSSLAKESIGPDKGHSKEAYREKKSKFSSGNLSKSCAMASTSKNGGKVEGQIFEVTRRPVVGKSTWFRELPWEERVQCSHDQGTLVLLQNLDPEYTSGEVEDIIWHAFNEYCTAKMIQRTAVSSPHSGQAFVIFKTKDAAEKVVRKLDDGCLMLPNRRPLVGCYGVLSRVSGRQATFAGHLAIDDIRRQIQREMKDAVSTSHYSQTNTIEYEMAMDWCLLQSRSDIWWKKIYEGQREQLKKLSANLKSN